MVEKYVLAKNVVSNRIDRDHPMYAFMICALYGLLCKYKEYDDLVIDCYKKTDFLFSEGTISEIVKEHGLQHKFNVEDYYGYALGASNVGFYISMDKYGNIVRIEENPIVVCSLDQPLEVLLNTFCHEVGHIIKGRKKSFYSYQSADKTFFVVRCGLRSDVLSKNKDSNELQPNTYHYVLDEAINSIQTTEIMQEILVLKDIADDPLVVNFVQQLNEDRLAVDQGYEDFCTFIRPLWNTPSFKEIVEQNIVSGDIPLIIDHFNEIAGNNMFEKMSVVLDTICKKGDQMDYTTHEKYVGEYVEIMFQYIEGQKKKKKE